MTVDNTATCIAYISIVVRTCRARTEKWKQRGKGMIKNPFQQIFPTCHKHPIVSDKEHRSEVRWIQRHGDCWHDRTVLRALMQPSTSTLIVHLHLNFRQKRSQTQELSCLIKNGWNHSSKCRCCSQFIWFMHVASLGITWNHTFLPK